MGWEFYTLRDSILTIPLGQPPLNTLSVGGSNCKFSKGESNTKNSNGGSTIEYGNDTKMPMGASILNYLMGYQ